MNNIIDVYIHLVNNSKKNYNKENVVKSSSK